MSYIVKCPHCNELNDGSQLHCAKCQTSLTGLPKEQYVSPTPEPVSPPYENYYGKLLKPLVPRDETTTRFTAKKTKKGVSKVLTIIFVVSTPFALLRMILLRAEGATIGLMFSWIFFVIGLAFFLVPAETLLRFDRQTGYFLYKMTPNEELGLGCASTFYTLFGLVFMLVPVGISLFLLIFGNQVP